MKDAECCFCAVGASAEQSDIHLFVIETCTTSRWFGGSYCRRHFLKVTVRAAAANRIQRLVITALHLLHGSLLQRTSVTETVIPVYNTAFLRSL